MLRRLGLGAATEGISFGFGYQAFSEADFPEKVVRAGSEDGRAATVLWREAAV